MGFVAGTLMFTVGTHEVVEMRNIRPGDWVMDHNPYNWQPIRANRIREFSYNWTDNTVTLKADMVTKPFTLPADTRIRIITGEYAQEMSEHYPDGAVVLNNPHTVKN